MTFSLAEDLAHTLFLAVEGPGKEAGAVLLTVTTGLRVRRMKGWPSGVMSHPIAGSTLAKRWVLERSPLRGHRRSTHFPTKERPRVYFSRSKSWPALNRPLLSLHCFPLPEESDNMSNSARTNNSARTKESVIEESSSIASPFPATDFLA